MIFRDLKPRRGPNIKASVDDIDIPIAKRGSTRKYALAKSFIILSVKYICRPNDAHRIC